MTTDGRKSGVHLRRNGPDSYRVTGSAVRNSGHHLRTGKTTAGLVPSVPACYRSRMDSSSSAFEAGQMFGRVFGFGIVIFTVVAIVFACVKRSRGWIITAVVCGGLIIAGMATVLVGSRTAASKPPVAMTSSDGRFTFNVPAHWKELPEVKSSLADADKGFGNPRRAEYMMLIIEPKENALVTLELLFEALADHARKNMPAAVIGTAKQARIGEYDALQRELSGMAEGHRFVWLQTAIETEDSWVQLTGWTLQSNKEGAFDEFRKVLDSFKRAKPAAGSADGKAVASSGEKPRRLKPKKPGEPAADKSAGAAGSEGKVKSILAELLGKKESEIQPSSRIVEDLGADELDAVEFIMALEEEFNVEVSDEAAEKLKTVGDVLDYLKPHQKAAPEPEPEKAPEAEKSPEESK